MTEHDSHLYEELSRLNNELVNMQREVAKKNAALERAQVELEQRVQARTLELQRAKEVAELAHATTRAELAKRERAEEELRRSRRMLQLVINHIPQAIFWKDRQSVYLGCNEQLAKDAGYAGPVNMVGRTDADMPWAEQAPAYLAADAFVMDNDVPLINVEERLTKADGSTIWLRMNKIPLHGGGAVIGVLGSYEDVTAKKEAEATLRAAKDEAERANAAKSEFLSRMSHELRTPMNSILGFAQIMEMDAPTEAQGVRLGHIMKAGRHLLSLIDEILDLTFAEPQAPRGSVPGSLQEEGHDA